MKQFKKGQWVWWKDPEGITSGLYQILNPGEISEEAAEAEEDDRIILIGNMVGSEAEVNTWELESPRSQVVFRRWWDHPEQPIIALFPEVITDEGQFHVLAYLPGCKMQVSYQKVIRESVEATKTEYGPLLTELRELGCDELYITTDRLFRRDQITETAGELAKKECAGKARKPIHELYDQRGSLKDEYDEMYNASFSACFARLAILAGYEEEKPAPRMLCPVCKGTDVACDARINPNTGEILYIFDDPDGACEQCGEVELVEPETE